MGSLLDLSPPGWGKKKKTAEIYKGKSNQNLHFIFFKHKRTGDDREKGSINLCFDDQRVFL